VLCSCLVFRPETSPWLFGPAHEPVKPRVSKEPASRSCPHKVDEIRFFQTKLMVAFLNIRLFRISIAGFLSFQRDFRWDFMSAGRALGALLMELDQLKLDDKYEESV
jgi:hypothetical protein